MSLFLNPSNDHFPVYLINKFSHVRKKYLKQINREGFRLNERHSSTERRKFVAEKKCFKIFSFFGFSLRSCTAKIFFFLSDRMKRKLILCCDKWELQSSETSFLNKCSLHISTFVFSWIHLRVKLSDSHAKVENPYYVTFTEEPYEDYENPMHENTNYVSHNNNKKVNQGGELFLSHNMRKTCVYFEGTF